MARDYANAPTPTLFHLFLTGADEAEAIEQKRFVRKVCEAVGASIDRKVRFKTTDEAGHTLVDGVPTPVAGFNIFAEASNDGQSYADDKVALMTSWWTPGGYVEVGLNRVMKQSAHAPGVELAFNGDIQDFVENTLGRTFEVPQAWTERAEREAEKARKEQEAAARRERKAAEKAAKALAAAKKAQVAAAAAQAATTTETETEVEEAVEAAAEELNEAEAA